MVFSSPVFLFLFLPLVLLGYALVPHKFRNLTLLAASVVFYTWGERRFFPVIFAMVGLNQAVALSLARWPARRRTALALGVGCSLLTLGVFKYTGFVCGIINQLLGLAHVTPLEPPEIPLPVGISFVTFHAISYVVDVARGDSSAQKRTANAALYFLFFPQLVAGPIIRYHDIAEQLERRSSTSDDLVEGIRRFVIGLGKKALLANALAPCADQVFGLPASQVGPGLAWLGALAYTGQIYFDFSGYSDMAIGLARMFGFRLRENFNYPYAGRSVQDFWRRWHISLSTWFRDYVYVPLGGNRRGRLRTYLNLLAIFFLCGLWHGPSWTFVAWGLYHGAFLVLERIFREREWLVAPPGPLRRGLGHVYMLLVVMFGWVLFRAETLDDALLRMASMLGLRHAASPAPIAAFATRELWLALAFGALGCLPLAAAAHRRWGTLGSPTGSMTKPGWTLATTFALALVFIASSTAVAAGSYNPFIYFRF